MNISIYQVTIGYSVNFYLDKDKAEQVYADSGDDWKLLKKFDLDITPKTIVKLLNRVGIDLHELWEN